MPFQRSNSKLLRELPWLTNVIMGGEQLLDPDFAAFARKVEEVEQELDGNSIAVQSARKVMLIDRNFLDDGTQIPSAHMSLVVSRILGYRILDIVQWLNKDPTVLDPQSVLPQAPRGELPFLKRLKLTKMADWPKVIRNAAKGVRLVEFNEVTAPMHDGTSHEQYLFNCAVEMQKQNKGLKVITNFMIAALHLGLIVKGNWDMANSELVSYVKSNQLNIAGSTEARFSCLRMPLSLAASLSPIALLLDKFLWKESSDKKVIIDLLLAFGAGKPAVIMEMERRIWLTLVDLAKGERQAVARVTRTLNEIDELVQSMDLGEMRGWFSDDFRGPQLPGIAPPNSWEASVASLSATGDQTSCKTSPPMLGRTEEEEEEEPGRQVQSMHGSRNDEQRALTVGKGREQGIGGSDGRSGQSGPSPAARHEEEEEEEEPQEKPGQLAGRVGGDGESAWTSGRGMEQESGGGDGRAGQSGGRPSASPLRLNAGQTQPPAAASMESGMAALDLGCPKDVEYAGRAARPTDEEPRPAPAAGSTAWMAPPPTARAAQTDRDNPAPMPKEGDPPDTPRLPSKLATQTDLDHPAPTPMEEDPITPQLPATLDAGNVTLSAQDHSGGPAATTNAADVAIIAPTIRAPSQGVDDTRDESAEMMRSPSPEGTGIESHPEGQGGRLEGLTSSGDPTSMGEDTETEGQENHREGERGVEGGDEANNTPGGGDGADNAPGGGDESGGELGRASGSSVRGLKAREREDREEATRAKKARDRARQLREAQERKSAAEAASRLRKARESAQRARKRQREKRRREKEAAEREERRENEATARQKRGENEAAEREERRREREAAEREKGIPEAAKEVAGFSSEEQEGAGGKSGRKKRPTKKKKEARGRMEDAAINLTDATPHYMDPVRVVGKWPLREEVLEEPKSFTHPHLTVGSRYPKITGQRTVLLPLLPSGTMSYRPSFHENQHQVELDAFYQLFDAVSTAGKGPRKIPYVIFKGFKASRAQEYMQHHPAIVIDGVPFQRRQFDWEGLRGVFGEASDLLCIDYTMETKGSKIGRGRDFIDAADGNVIATKRAHIMASRHCPPKSLTSDEVSWLHTIDQPFCKRKQNVPRSETQWEAASTKGAFERWTVPLYGYCTFINVVAGAQWVLIARSKDAEVPELTYGVDGLTSFEPYGTNSKLWDVDAVVVQAGSQLILGPSTPYRALSIDDTISGGGSFYSIYDIEASCIGFMQTFVDRSIFSDDIDCSNSARLLLARMLMYVHQQLVVHGGLDEKYNRSLHLPDPTTMDGLFSITSLINVAELANVLHPDTYAGGVPPKERMFLIHVRSLGRELKRVMGSKIRLQAEGGEASLSVTSWANGYLHYQASALYNYKRIADSVGITPRPPGFTRCALESGLLKCLGPTIWIEDDAPTFSWSQDHFQVVKVESEGDEPHSGEQGGETLDDMEWIAEGTGATK